MMRLRLAIPLMHLALTGAAVAQEREQVCRDIEHRTPTVGSWATFRWTGGPSDGSTMRLAVIGREPVAGTNYYWFEMKIDDPQRPKAGMIMQMLITGLGYRAADVRSLVMKTGDHPAMRMPEQMVRMMAGQMQGNMAAEIARQCAQMQVVGWERVMVPAGTFRALHLQHPRTGMHVWVQTDLQFGMVKTTMTDGSVMVLTGQGTGAKSSITETP